MMLKVLNAPYGGTLVKRVVSLDNFRIFENIPILNVNGIIESDFLNIAMGAFSPLTGFLGSKDFHSVCKDNHLESANLPWTIPIVFDLNEDQKNMISGHEIVLLRSESSKKLIGYIEVSEIYPHNKILRIEGTYRVTDISHPGVALIHSQGPYLLAGKVTAFESVLSNEPFAYPEAVREKLTEMKLSKVAGFQTRNVVHRAHEYLQRVALEVTDGLLIQPVIGWKKAGDFRPEAIKIGYRKFIDNYYPKDRVLLAFINLAMRYAGPKEAIFHAIVRKNFGCSHFIVGRDHAGVGGFYGRYESHELIDRLPSIGVEFLKLNEPFYCKSCEGIATDHSCGHEESVREYISGTKIRNILVNGKNPEKHIFRSDVLDSLRELGEEGLFYE